MPRKKIQPDTELTAFARRYAVQKERDERMLLSHCRRFEAIIGAKPIAEYNNGHMAEYRRLATRRGLSPKTTEKLLIDVRTIIKAATGKMLLPGRNGRWNQPDTLLMKAAQAYQSDNGLRSGTLVKNCRRFYRATEGKFGDIEPAEVGAAHFAEFRKQMLAAEKSKTSIEKIITDVATVVKTVTGKAPDVGRRLRRNRPMPKPVSIDHIEQVFAIAPAWMQQWLALTTWTGARLKDSMALQIKVNAGEFKGSDTMTHQAEKTGKVHSWPIPKWLLKFMKPVELPFHDVSDFASDNVRKHLAELCERAGVSKFTPKNVRQRAVTQWMRANGAAGAILHGSSLGVLAHYIDPTEVLFETMPRVVMPKCFMDPDSEQVPASVTDLFSGLDDSQRAMIVQMVAMMGRRT